MIKKSIYLIMLLMLLFLTACSSSSTNGDTRRKNESYELSNLELEAYNFKILEDYYKEKKYNYAFDRYNQYYDTFRTKETKEKADEIYNDIFRQLINDETQHTLLKSLITKNDTPYHTESLPNELLDQIDKFLEQYGNNTSNEEDVNVKNVNEENSQEGNAKKETGIRIGMTSDEVLERWGKPKDINKTITQYGVHEQWVYPNYQYLYFDDGILTTIQQ
ncbi:hypothetical protein ACQKCU_15085 [Heyndrickxia sporothermodurans]